MTLATKLFSHQWKSLQVLSKYTSFRSMSTTESIAKRNKLFDEETQRQQDSIGRIEKIEVRYLGLPEDVTLMMNRGISTPFNCAQHLTQGHCQRSALALVDGNVPWDMYRPLQESCTLQLLNFTVADPHLVNNFPTNEDYRNQWSVFCKTKCEDLKTNDRLCSLHFDPSAFKISLTKTERRLKLKPNVVPTIFNTMGNSRAGPSQNNKQVKGDMESKTKKVNLYCCLCGVLNSKIPRFSTNHGSENLEEPHFTDATEFLSLIYSSDTQNHNQLKMISCKNDVLK